MQPVEVLVVVVFTAVAAIVVWHFAARHWRTARRRKRAYRARRGELVARDLLEQWGFTVLAAQVPAVCEYWCDGRMLEASLRADYLVERRSRRYVAEVKTGSVVTSLDHAPTRRQLLEYQIAYRTEGVLLVNVERGELQNVRFHASQRSSGVIAPLVIGGLLGAAMTGWLASF